ncbi:uncharacterized protein LOC119093363 [Pollicipes pollicipes]|uniref:uncharacterized protein LOC119093363 n=1 Tax=Pollicipes pollicipes TaxID=41117 RepID=UPI001885008E|nr:uncharacterized protein LOC119093363 [Pollicipes pollicipes]
MGSGKEIVGRIVSRTASLRVGETPAKRSKKWKRQHRRLLVNVGCCYHLQRERFEGDFWRELDPADETFPLCSLLTRRRYVLGQQARGLAAQASERMASYQRSPSPALYYRAVLQVYLRDKAGRRAH